jgi:hypothetical protein
MSIALITGSAGLIGAEAARFFTVVKLADLLQKPFS